MVVSLASCNSGNVGSVAGAGASIAHALHEAGIPMVVAGQFPALVRRLGAAGGSAVRGTAVGRGPAPAAQCAAPPPACRISPARTTGPA
ncbi:MAG: hypothetical protein MZW92_15495 [Comamonadaceae bacterium]|nr:hypothetical protein [Comamonadaceae bacterium]